MAETWNPLNLRSFGDMDSDVFVSPLGTAEPADPTYAFPAPWGALGCITEDGASEGNSVDTTKFKIWQGGKTAKTKTNGTEKTMQVSAAETNPLVFELFYDAPAAVVTAANATTGAAASAKITLPEGSSTVARTVAFKYTEGDIIWIRYNTRAEITDRGSVSYNNTSIASREMTFDLLGTDIWITNDPAFTTP